MTKEQEAKEILNKFKNNETQRDKLERGRDGGWKIGDIYKHLELNPAIETVLSMLKEKDKEIEHQKEKRNNQKQELAILNEKQKEMNKLINIVSSYKGMFKKQQKEMKKKDKQIDLMAEYISKIDIEEDVCIKNKTNPDWCNEDYTNCKSCIKQYFERKSHEI